MKQALALGAAVLILVFGTATSAYALPTVEAPPQEHGKETATEEHSATTEHDAHGEAEAHDGDEAQTGHHDRSHLKNEVAFFLGATDEHGHDTEFTLGVDYKRRVADRVAVGGFLDHAGGELRNSLVGALVFWWPWRTLALYAGPAMEFHDGRNQDGAGGDDGHGEGGDSNENYFVVRVGAGWDFHIGEHYGIIPTVILDLVEGEKVWVYGLAISYGW